MADKQHYTPHQVAEALRKSFGVKTVAAQLLGCTDDTITNYAKRYKVVEKAVRESRSKIVDIAEYNLINDLTVKEECPNCREILRCSSCNNTIQFGKDWATRFVLMTLGKDRGYTERKEITGKDGGAIEITQLESTLVEIQTIIVESLKDHPQALESVVRALRARKDNGNGNGREL